MILGGSVAANASSSMGAYIMHQLASGRFVSGSHLAESLGCSRTAIWYAIERLRTFGIVIDAVPGRGYRLADPFEPLDQDRIIAAMTPEALTRLGGIELLAEVDSTNRWMIDRLSELPQGQILLAEYQSAGRGRRGRYWLSGYGGSILLSLHWRFDRGPAALTSLSLVVGAILADALQQLGITGIALKWPNDLLLDGAKVGGILLELRGESSGPSTTVIGIGLNLKLPTSTAVGIDQRYGELSHHLGSFSRNQLIGKIISSLLPALASYEKLGPAPYLARWRDFDHLYGEAVVLQLPQGNQYGIARGIDDDGALLLEGVSGYQRVQFGEVTLRKDTTVRD